MKKSICLFFCLCTASAIASDGELAILDSAFKKMTFPEGDRCTFERVEHGEDGIIVEHYSPDSGWSLVSVAGVSPSKRALKKYAKAHKERSERQHPATVDFDELAQPDSWQLVSSNAESSIFFFKPLAEDEDEAEFIDAMEGTVTVAHKPTHVQSFSLRNTRPFSPAAMVTVQEMSHAIEFQAIGQGRFAAREILVRVRGKAFGLKKIEQDQQVAFRQFACPNTTD